MQRLAFWSRRRSRPENGLDRRLAVGGTEPRRGDCWHAIRAPSRPEKPGDHPSGRPSLPRTGRSGRRGLAMMAAGLLNGASKFAPPKLALRVLF
jgi:hypothetical protein